VFAILHNEKRVLCEREDKRVYFTEKERKKEIGGRDDILIS
jgi:hypothetical protein